jgi:dGTP triphosphohydrolase
MDWDKLTTPYRLGCPKDHIDNDCNRGEFYRDFDRIVFWSAFRRLQAKTGFPFP